MAKKEKGEKKKGSCLMTFLVSVLIVLALAIVVPLIVIGTGDTKKEGNTEKQVAKEETDANGWTEDDKINFKTIVEMTSDEYIGDYKSPWALDDWVFAKFDDTDKVIVTTKYTLKESSEKQPVICVFSWKPETEEYKSRFLSIGDNIYLDDGSCDEVFEKISGLATSTENN